MTASSRFRLLYYFDSLFLMAFSCVEPVFPIKYFVVSTLTSESIIEVFDGVRIQEKMSLMQKLLSNVGRSLD